MLRMFSPFPLGIFEKLSDWHFTRHIGLMVLVSLIFPLSTGCPKTRPVWPARRTPFVSFRVFALTACLAVWVFLAPLPSFCPCLSLREVIIFALYYRLPSLHSVHSHCNKETCKMIPQAHESKTIYITVLLLLVIVSLSQAFTTTTTSLLARPPRHAVLPAGNRHHQPSPITSKTTTRLNQASVYVPLKQDRRKTLVHRFRHFLQDKREQHAARQQINKDTNNSSASAPADVPRYRQLIHFWSTTLLIWLSEPLLSLVDTTVVGLQPASLLQLAAMGPATTLMDTALYMTYFLAICTTNQVTQYKAVKNYRALQQSVSHIMGVAAVMGLTVAGVLWQAGPWLLRSMSGASTSTQVLGLASQYCWIRGAVAPISIMGMIAQAFCLATLDTKTPAVAVVVATVLNVVGDLVLTPFWGMQGAALATAVASVSASSILLRAVWKQVRMWRQEEIQQTSGSATTTTATDDAAAVAVPAPIPFLSLPDPKSLWHLFKLSFPLAFNMWSKMASYTALTIAAAPYGVTAMAAHNILMRVFFFLGCFADALGQSAQSFLPATLYPVFRKSDFKTILKRLGVLAAGTSLLIGTAGRFLLQSAGQYIAKDVGVIRTLQNTSVWVGLALAMHPLIVLKEGTVIATRDFANLIKTYVVTLGVHCSLLRFGCTSFLDVWKVLCAFQVVRLLNYNMWGRLRPQRHQEPEPQMQETTTIVVDLPQNATMATVHA